MYQVQSHLCLNHSQTVPNDDISSYIAPGDYTATTQVVTFSPGQTTQTISVPTATDTLVEDDEVFQAVLSLVSANVMLQDETATATIQDASRKLNCEISGFIATIIASYSRSSKYRGTIDDFIYKISGGWDHSH